MSAGSYQIMIDSQQQQIAQLQRDLEEARARWKDTSDYCKEINLLIPNKIRHTILAVSVKRLVDKLYQAEERQRKTREAVRLLAKDVYRSYADVGFNTAISAALAAIDRINSSPEPAVRSAQETAAINASGAYCANTGRSWEECNCGICERGQSTRTEPAVKPEQPKPFVQPTESDSAKYNSAVDASNVSPSTGAGAISRNECIPSPGISKLTCMDCPAPYGEDGWCDVIIPNEIWNRIASTTLEPPSDDPGGVLCFRCMTKRLESSGRSCVNPVPVIVASGPYRDANEEWRLIGWKHGHEVGREELREECAKLREVLRRVLTTGNKTNMSVQANREAFDLAIHDAWAALAWAEQGEAK